MTPSDFYKLSNFITQNYGIKMPIAKKIMLQSRLQKRLRALNITSYKEYIEFLFSKKGIQEEMHHMIDMVSTNKTDFFREPSHFDFLSNYILPEFLKRNSGKQLFKIWSAGCSSGEEPYTIAMVLSEFILLNPTFDFSIFGTDVSTRMLQKAVSAIYDEERVNIIPINLKKKYLLRSKNSEKRTVRIIANLRYKANFKRLNFIDETYHINELFDVVFCRNVLIYFDRETQENVISKLCTKIKKGGYFFLGHSESIINMDLPLKQVKPTVFRRT